MTRDSIELMGAALALTGLERYEIRFETCPGAASSAMNVAFGRRASGNKFVAAVAGRQPADIGNLAVL